MAPKNPVRAPDVSSTQILKIKLKLIIFFQPPIVVVIDDDKPVRKSPPESEKESKRDREICLSMAPLPIPLGPLGGFAGKNIFKFLIV